MGFYIFQIITSLLFLGIQYFLFRNFRIFSGEQEKFRKFLLPVAFTFVIFNIPIVIALGLRIFGFGTPEWVAIHVMPPVYIWHFISVVLFLSLLTGKVLKIPFLTMGWLLGRLEVTKPFVRAVRSNGKLRNFDIRRRQAVRQTLTILTGTAALGSVYEIYRKDTFDKTFIRIPVKDLPESFHGFSIGFISDIHSGIFMSAERMRAYAEAVNALGADLIVVTGDFVNSQLEEAYPFREAFSILSAQHGVYGVLGNHDFYTRKVEEVAREVEKGGISLLRNRHLVLTKGGDSLHLAGVDDTGNVTTASRYFGSVKGPDNAPVSRILLCHRPYFFREAASAGFDVILSGHTHGGQVVLGELGKDVLAPARLVSPYVAGIYSEGDARMYVSRGIGTVGVPFRFNCPPEITKIVLERATGA